MGISCLDGPFPQQKLDRNDTAFGILSTDFQEYPILSMDMCFETSESTADFLVDAVSMEPVGEATI